MADKSAFAKATSFAKAFRRRQNLLADRLGGQGYGGQVRRRQTC